jgi:hypothetical protein
MGCYITCVSIHVCLIRDLVMGTYCVKGFVHCAFKSSHFCASNVGS